MKKSLQFGIAGMLSATTLIISDISARAADINVYAQGAYTAADLVVYLYADINTVDSLVSAGVQLNYDNSKLRLVSAQKNDKDWYFGTPLHKYAYQDPQDTGSAVVFLCGKIDENAPMAGVAGARKLIGKATFARIGSGGPVTSPETYFGAALGPGITRTSPDQFANFVTTNGEVLDAGRVSYTVRIVQRGDASEDGVINDRDITALKKNIGKMDLPVWFDCTNDGVVDSRDITCLQRIILSNRGHYRY